MRSLFQIFRFASLFSKRNVSQPISQPEDVASNKVVTRTRYRLSLFSFLILSVAFSISFYQANVSIDNERTALFLDFTKHISYVLGAVVASYIGMESIFPSTGGYGWRRRWDRDDMSNPYGGRYGYQPDQDISKKEEGVETPSPDTNQVTSDDSVA